ncbi:MAG: hypothetical protein MJ207_02510 [Bacilli bacterium]|nr:hypothetical protein [Bacilli bacterium]
MKFVRYLLIVSQAFVFVACAKSENLPPRKDGNVCNITWDLGEHVTVLGGAPTTAPMDKDFTFSIRVPYYHKRMTDWKVDEDSGEPIKPTPTTIGELDDPNMEYAIALDKIHVYIGGEDRKEYEGSYQFLYVDNTTNEFVINGKYMVNDVKIVIETEEREQPLALYGLEFSETLDKRIDYTDHEEEGIVPKTGDIKVEFRSKYQDIREPIMILNHGQRAFPIFEHDEIEVTLTVPTQTPGKELPEDIVVRTGAHYATLDVDFTREYTTDRFQCVITIPTYVVRDHVTIAKYGET